MTCVLSAMKSSVPSCFITLLWSHTLQLMVPQPNSHQKPKTKQHYNKKGNIFQLMSNKDGTSWSDCIVLFAVPWTDNCAVTPGNVWSTFVSGRRRGGHVHLVVERPVKNTEIWGGVKCPFKKRFSSGFKGPIFTANSTALSFVMLGSKNLSGSSRKQLI